MLADPQSITYNSVAYSLARVGNTALSAAYRDSDFNFELRTGHSTAKNGRVRSAVSLYQRTVAADPMSPTINAEFTRTLSIVLNEPKFGFTSANRTLFVDTFLDYLRASTDAVPLAVFGGQV